LPIATIRLVSHKSYETVGVFIDIGYAVFTLAKTRSVSSTWQKNMDLILEDGKIYKNTIHEEKRFTREE